MAHKKKKRRPIPKTTTAKTPAVSSETSDETVKPAVAATAPLASDQQPSSDDKAVVTAPLASDQQLSSDDETALGSESPLGAVVVPATDQSTDDDDDADDDDDDDGDGDDGDDDDGDDALTPVVPAGQGLLNRYGLAVLIGGVFAAVIAVILVLGLSNSNSNKSPQAQATQVKQVKFSDGVIAKVGKQEITQSQFKNWLQVALASISSQSPTSNLVIDPPTYTKCVAALENQKVAKGSKKTTPTAALAQCKEEYSQSQQEVTSFLIEGVWVRQEATRENVTVTAAGLAKEIKKQFPKVGSQATFLKQSHETSADLNYQLSTVVLENGLDAKAVGKLAKPTAAQIAKYYQQNKQTYGTKKTRDLEVILTKTQKAGQTARAAIQGGQSFTSAVKKYSTDATTKKEGGQLKGIAQGEEQAALNKAIFAAPVNVLTGPVKTTFGWVLFEVTATHPATQKTLAQVKNKVATAITAKAKQTKLSNFSTSFEARYKKITLCATEYAVSSCSNAPKTPATPQVSGGAAAPSTTTSTSTSK